MPKKPDKTPASPELVQAQQRIEAIKEELAQALIHRNTLPKSATDEEKAAAAARVEQLQAHHHDAKQRVLAIKLEETARLEREHKEKKLRHKQLRASRQPGSHTAPRDEPAPHPHRSSARRPMDRAEEEALMDAANEVDLFLERQRQEEEDRESAEELAHQRRVAQKLRRREEAAKRRDARKRERMKAEASAETARLEAERKARAQTRQQEALRRTEETKAQKRQRRIEREARQREARDAQPSGWLSGLLQRIKAMFRRPR